MISSLISAVCVAHFRAGCCKRLLFDTIVNLQACFMREPEKLLSAVAHFTRKERHFMKVHQKNKTDCVILREDGMEFGNYFMQTNTIKLTLAEKYIIHFQSEVKVRN